MIRAFVHSVPRVLFFLMFLGMVVSCRTPEQIPEMKLRPVSAPGLYRKARENTFQYRMFAIKKIGIQVNSGKTSTSFRAGVQAIRDSCVLISVTKLNIVLARIMLTPDQVTYVNYFNRSYYTGDYTPFRSLLNFDVDFRFVQAILAADIFSVFEDEKELREYKSWIENNQYVLQSETTWKLNRMEDRGKTQRIGKILKRNDENIPVTQTCYLDPRLFRVRRLTLEERFADRRAEMTFDDFEPVEGQYFPASVNVEIVSDKGILQIFTNMSGFSTGDSSLNLLTIPENFERVYVN